MVRRRMPAILAAVAVLICGGAGLAQAAAGAARVAKPRLPALRLVAASPKGTAPVPGDSTITLRFSAPLAPLTRRSEPRLSPSTSGAWTQPNPTTLRFTPTGGYLPGTVVHVVVPKGLAATNGAVLRKAVAMGFQVEAGSTVRLTQVLADLRYLPVHLASTANQPRPGDTAGQLRAISRRLRRGSCWGPIGPRNSGTCGITIPRPCSGAR
jgi:hypothetical protein